MGTISFEDLTDVVGEAIVRMGDNAENVKKDFESFGIDYTDIRRNMTRIMGKMGGAMWLAGFHAGLSVASKYWEYRIPPSYEGAEND